MTLDELKALVSSDPKAQEAYYLEAGPDKHEQEWLEGVGIVEMNVSLLRCWLEEEYPEAFAVYLTVSENDKRAVWEASDFHYGICSYEKADADYYWAREEINRKRIINTERIINISCTTPGQGKSAIIAELVDMKIEESPYSNALVWMAYFASTPNSDDLMAAFRSKYPSVDPKNAAYRPERCDDVVSNKAGLERWFICQRV